MSYTNILSQSQSGITTITINRPSKLNALNSQTIEELHTAFERADADTQTKVIIITGSGDKAFVAGADISEFADFDVEEGKYLAADGQHKLFDFIETLSIPVIAAVNGFALGGGLELAMACHFRIASDNAKMGLPEVSLGVIPGYGGTQRLPQLVGKGRAMEMIMTANMITANEAREYGLVNYVTTQEDLLSFSTDEARNLYNTIKGTIAVENLEAAVGGRGAESIEEIRQNAIATFGSQNRAVTSKDYQVRVLSMPTKYGSIAKAYATADGTLDNNSPSSILSSPKALQEFTDLVMSFVEKPDNEEPDRKSVQQELQKFLIGKTSNENEKNNPFAINLYLLGYNADGKLDVLNSAVKENLKTYLNEYKILTDGVNINDGFIINIGINFEIMTYNNYNKSEVVTQCIQELKDYFDINNWSFNQTINLSELELLIANVDGVSSVPKLEIVNKCGGQYSPNSYNVTAAIKDKILYPSLDPSVFEIKFPNADIKGRAR